MLDVRMVMSTKLALFEACLNFQGKFFRCTDSSYREVVREFDTRDTWTHHARLTVFLQWILYLRIVRYDFISSFVVLVLQTRMQASRFVEM